jgi:hypothetical protein
MLASTDTIEVECDIDKSWRVFYRNDWGTMDLGGRSLMA